MLGIAVRRTDPTAPVRPQAIRAAAATPAGVLRRHLAALALALAVALPCAAAAEPDTCASPPEAAAELRAIAAERAACPAGQECDLREGRRLAALAAAHPDDVAVQRAWQEHALQLRGEARRAALEPMRVRFAAAVAARPEDPAVHYLAGRLAGTDEERRAAFERAHALDPAFPWARLGLAVVRGRGRQLAPADAAAVREHLDAFLAACPSRFREVMWLAPRLGGEDFWSQRAAALRAAVLAAPPADQAASLRRLWDLEFQLTPPAEHDAVRRRIRGDLARIESFDLASDPRWWSLRSVGWERLGEPERRDAIDAGAAERFPCSDQAEDVFQRRLAELGPPANDLLDSSEEHRSAVERLARQSLEDCPDGFVFSVVLFQALAADDDLDPETRRREYREHLRVWEANRSRVRMAETPFARVAGELLRRGLDPGRAVELAWREIGETGELDLTDPPSTSLPAELVERQRIGRGARQAVNRALVAEASLAAGDPSSAGESLAKAEEMLAIVEPAAAGMPPEAMVHAARRRVLTLRGRLAEAEDRPADALAFHLAALPPGEGGEEGEGADRRLASLARPAGGEGSEQAASRLWQALGGSRATFTLVAGAAAAPGTIARPGAWQPSDEPLADFALSDLEGRTWRLADFAGRTLLVNLWATWCGPCRQELPYVEELHRRLAGREDVAVVTLNADYELGAIAPFLAEEGYTFPVLLAEDHIMETQRAISIPQTWIVDGAGRLRHRQDGFSLDRAEGWVEDALALLEATAAGGGAADGGGEAAVEPAAPPAPAEDGR